jgi:1-acyl-sn-glycerol-3-phosphate acyltransferase
MVKEIPGGIIAVHLSMPKSMPLRNIGSRSTGYSLLKAYVRFAHWIIHGRITVNGSENLPSDHPVILAPNHQNALLDPLAVLCYAPYQPVWLTRADVFSNSITRPLLRFLKMIPVYRLRDGADSLGNNEHTFQQSVEVLSTAGVLALFPEAAHSYKRHMLPHKKAVPRIAFMAEEKTNYSLNIMIVPVGVNYSHYWHMGRKLVINYGKPVPVKDYLPEYQENPQRAVISLKNKIEKELTPLIINIENSKYYDGFEAVIRICADFAVPEPTANSSEKWYLQEKYIAGKLNELAKSDPVLSSRLADNALAFEKQLRKMRIRSWLINPHQEQFLRILADCLLLVMTAPLALTGVITNALPFLITDGVVRKRVRDISFRGSFFLGLGIVVFPLAYLIEWSVAAPFLPEWWQRFLLLAAMPFAGKVSFRWYILLRKTLGRARWWRTKRFHPGLYARLHALKKEICHLAGLDS